MKRPSDRELALRRTLGIPDDARRVLVLGESSHWDPNWLCTSEEYYALRVRKTLKRAVEALEREPTRVYSAESVFYLRMFWDREPRFRERMRALVNAGRLRITAPSITTPDTLLPDTEALLRDVLYGQEWLRRRGMTQEPKVAYLPDNFGNSPFLPTLLRAAGIESVAFARLDGSYFPGCDNRPAHDFPLPGSNTARLVRDEKSLDFVWRDASGAEVVARFHGWGYGQGDLLAHRGLTRWMEWPLAFSDRSEANVAAKVEAFVGQIEPVSRTPYLFCPMGFDFVDPIPELVPLLDRYNRRRFPETSTFVVNAAIDDYLDLVAEHRDVLPVLDLDPNPYWTGFYASRPGLKQQCRRVVDVLLDLERAALALGERLDGAPQEDGAKTTQPSRFVEGEALSEAWYWAVVGNHHDYITGTSPNRVHAKEQAPRTLRALQVAEEALHRVQRAASTRVPSSSARATTARPSHRWASGLLHVEANGLRVTIDPREGGTIDVVEANTGESLLRPRSFDLVSFHDSGGLWRMGHEYRGGKLEELARASASPAEVKIEEAGDTLAVTIASTVASDEVVRTLLFRADREAVPFFVEGLVAPRRTLTCRFAGEPFVAPFVMDTPGGVVSRPFEKLFHPTFWSVNRFVSAKRRRDGKTFALLFPGPASISGDESGRLEVVALRNATKEQAYGILPMLGFPARGREREPFRFQGALFFGGRSDWMDDRLPFLARETFADDREEFASARALGEGLVRVHGGEAIVLAVKPASRGSGIVVRLYVPSYQLARSPEAVEVEWSGGDVVRATLCDARERDLSSLELRSGRVRLPIDRSILSLRLEVS